MGSFSNLKNMTAQATLQNTGWIYLPYRFDTDGLAHLSALNPHTGRGCRLTDMTALADALPFQFKACVSEFGFNPKPLRAVGFNKSNETNWSLPWHQDRVIAVAEKTSHTELKNWTRKSGVWHCEPTSAVLAQMAFAYITFDDIHDAMGGLELAEGTHKFGSIPEAEIESHIQTAVKIRPDMKIGQTLLVSALTLHRSAPMMAQGNRRSLRIDFACDALNLTK